MTISEERFTDLQEPPSAIAAFIREPSDFVETIHVYGDVDLSNSVELERAINAPRPADHSIVVDLANCQYVDSTALATLVRAKKRLGTQLKIRVPQDGSVRRLFELCGLVKYLC